MADNRTPTPAAACANRPMRRAGPGGWPLALCCAALAGCGSTPPATEVGTASRAAQGPAELQATWRQRQIDRARQIEAAGQWPQALLLWQGLRLLEPTDPLATNEAARLARRIDEAALDHDHRGDAALRRNDLDGAEYHYAHLLALQPDHPRARLALRQIESQRLRRQPGAASMAPPAPRSGP